MEETICCEGCAWFDARCEEARAHQERMLAELDAPCDDAAEPGEWEERYALAV